jgi:hypothetical protein
MEFADPRRDEQDRDGIWAERQAEKATGEFETASAIAGAPEYAAGGYQRGPEENESGQENA